MMNNLESVHPLDAEPIQLELRPVTRQDIPALIRLLIQVIPTIPTYSHIPVEPNRVRTLIEANADNPDMFAYIFVYDTQIVGVGLGLVLKYGFSDSLHAQDLLIYIAPEHRNIVRFTALIHEFHKWAREHGADRVFMSHTSGIKPEAHARLMSRLGFEEIGRTFLKEI